MPNKPVSDVHNGSKVSKVKQVVVEYEDGRTDALDPVEFGEVKLVFRDGRLAQDETTVKNKRF